MRLIRKQAKRGVPPEALPFLNALGELLYAVTKRDLEGARPRLRLLNRPEKRRCA